MLRQINVDNSLFVKTVDILFFVCYNFAKERDEYMMNFTQLYDQLDDLNRLEGMKNTLNNLERVRGMKVSSVKSPLDGMFDSFLPCFKKFERLQLKSFELTIKKMPQVEIFTEEHSATVPFCDVKVCRSMKDEMITEKGDIVEIDDIIVSIISRKLLMKALEM